MDSINKNLIEKYIKDDNKKKIIYEKIVVILSKNKISLKNWNNDSKENVVELLAHLFTYWTFSEMKDRFFDDMEASLYLK